MNDIVLQKCVVRQLQRDCGVEPDRVGVEVHHGVVKLAGWLQSDSERELVRRTVEKIEGVSTVVVDIDIRSDVHR